MARFDLIARIYDVLPIPTHAEALASRLDGLPGPRLDVGGGTGRFTAGIHQGARPKVVLDASQGMLARGQRAGRPVVPVRGVGQGMPFRDGAFGAVSITEAFHHFAPVQGAVLDEIARVLAPGGVLVIEEIDPGRFLGRAVELGENLLMRFGSRFLAPEDLVAMVEERFGEVAWERTGALTYLVEARGRHADNAKVTRDTRRSREEHRA